MDRLLVEEDFPALIADQSCQRLPEGRLAGAGFADEPEGFMSPEVKRQTIHRNEIVKHRAEKAAAAQTKRYPDILAFEQNGLVVRQWLGPAAWL